MVHQKCHPHHSLRPIGSADGRAQVLAANHEQTQDVVDPLQNRSSGDVRAFGQGDTAGEGRQTENENESNGDPTPAEIGARQTFDGCVGIGIERF